MHTLTVGYCRWSGQTAHLACRYTSRTFAYSFPTCFNCLSNLTRTNNFQVANPRGGQLVDVQIPKGYMLVLTGYTLEHVTCGIFKAAPHTVVGRVQMEIAMLLHAIVAWRPLLDGLVIMVAVVFLLLRLGLLSICAQQLCTCAQPRCSANDSAFALLFIKWALLVLTLMA